MRVRGETVAWSWRSLLVAGLLLLAAAPGCLAKDEPTLKTSTFSSMVRNLNYFEDSDVVLFQDETANDVYRSTDGGATWSKIKDVPAGAAYYLIMHEFDRKRAYILTEGKRHYRTHDRGETWQEFFTDSEFSVFRTDILSFHADDPDRIVFNGMDCIGIFCEEEAVYTLDGFRTDGKFLRGHTAGCWWARSSKLFSTGNDDLDKNRILCIARSEFSPFKHDQRLFMSDTFFSAAEGDSKGRIKEVEPPMDTTRPVAGVVNLAVVKKFMLVATASKNTDEMALYVTDDTITWHRAQFPADHRLDEEAYTVLESTAYSIQIDVMTGRPSAPMGVLFTSNSNGTYFTRNVEHTNRNDIGHVDFEKISGIQGVFLVNIVENADAVEAKHAEKRVVTRITFDDGRTLEPVRGKDRDGKEHDLHLHSVTDLHNVGRVFSSPAPGLVMGIGNTGDHLEAWAKKSSSLWISDDAGRTWIEGPKGPHKYEFGDSGSILLAVHDSTSADVGEITWSLDHGMTWKTTPLPDGLKIKPYVLTTTQDSTSLKFILTGYSGTESAPKWHVVSIDFDGLHEATCKDSDFEDWSARVDDKGNPTCIMGHTQKYRRRKKTAECFVKSDFKEPEVKEETCECTDADFECDFNFVRSADGKNCEPAGPITAPENACKDPGDTFKGPNGWRKIPGNTCKGGVHKDDPIDRKCSDTAAPSRPPASGKISSTQHVFDGFDEVEIHYLERGDSSTMADETVIVRPLKSGRKRARGADDIRISYDHGKTWDVPKKLKGQDIWGIVPHQSFKDMVFFVRADGDVIYTVDRGHTFHAFKAPTKPDVEHGTNPLVFHPDNKNWLIWIGKKCEDDGKGCRLEASLSRDRGDHWETLLRYVEKCEFTGSSAYKFRTQRQILCVAYAREDSSKKNNPRQLVSFDDFESTKVVQLENILNFATMAEFIIVARGGKDGLEALASLDGITYAPARFPYNFKAPHPEGYTVLDSSTHAINLFVVGGEKSSEGLYGTIIKSNSNGTSYVVSINNVNCNQDYYVDFEKMLGLEGVVMVNVLANPGDKAGKRLQTQISHNDGAQWSFLPPPTKDVHGVDYPCRSAKGDADCALHIHGYTERRDHKKTYSSESAVGLMLGLGNVGPHLGELMSEETDTFMTTDAGITWRNIKKGRHLWQYGDQGSIIVLAPLGVKTRKVSYSTDEGATWIDYEFSKDEIMVTDLTTQRSGASRSFIVWGTGAGGSIRAINLDFSGLADRACEQKKPGEEDSDYYLWSPKHSMQDNGCLFGHVSQYLRKKTDRKCFNDFKIHHLYNLKNCTCSRQDYEWYVLSHFIYSLRFISFLAILCSVIFMLFHVISPPFPSRSCISLTRPSPFTATTTSSWSATTSASSSKACPPPRVPKYAPRRASSSTTHPRATVASRSLHVKGVRSSMTASVRRFPAPTSRTSTIARTPRVALLSSFPS